MLHAGLDWSRRKVDVCLLSAGGEVRIRSSPCLSSARLSLRGPLEARNFPWATTNAQRPRARSLRTRASDG
jgi:hypothetical protein